jgi:hypothetical protein
MMGGAPFLPVSLLSFKESEKGVKRRRRRMRA